MPSARCSPATPARPKPEPSKRSTSAHDSGQPDAALNSGDHFHGVKMQRGRLRAGQGCSHRTTPCPGARDAAPGSRPCWPRSTPGSAGSSSPTNCSTRIPATTGFEPMPEPNGLALHDDPFSATSPSPATTTTRQRHCTSGSSRTPTRFPRRAPARTRRSATISASSPPCCAATSRPTTTSPAPPHSPTAPAPPTSRPRPTWPGARCSPNANAPGDRERARHLLTAAHAAAVAHGYAGIERAAADALEHLDRN